MVDAHKRQRRKRRSLRAAHTLCVVLAGAVHCCTASIVVFAVLLATRGVAAGERWASRALSRHDACSAHLLCRAARARRGHVARLSHTSQTVTYYSYQAADAGSAAPAALPGRGFRMALTRIARLRRRALALRGSAAAGSRDGVGACGGAHRCHAVARRRRGRADGRCAGRAGLRLHRRGQPD